MDLARSLRPRLPSDIRALHLFRYYWLSNDKKEWRKYMNTYKRLSRFVGQNEFLRMFQSLSKYTNIHVRPLYWLSNSNTRHIQARLTANIDCSRELMKRSLLPPERPAVISTSLHIPILLDCNRSKVLYKSKQRKHFANLTDTQCQPTRFNATSYASGTAAHHYPLSHDPFAK